MPLADWLLPLSTFVGVLLGLEIVYVLLRRSLRRYRVRLLYHAWAVAAAGWSAGTTTALPQDGGALWKLLLTAAALLSAVILFSFIEVLVLLRPWSPQRGAMMPKLARDVVRLLLAGSVALAAAHLVFGYDLKTITISSTVLLAVLGLALQELLKNIFAGMSLQIERPFKNGDWLMMENGQLAEIVDMSWRATRLRTNEGVEISEPNSLLATARLFNYGSGQSPVAFALRVSLPYSTPPARARAVLLEAIVNAPGVVETPPSEVFLESFADHAVIYRIRAWTQRVASATRFVDEVQSRIWYALQRHDIPIPFPVRTLEFHHTARETNASQVSDRARAAALLGALEIFDGLPGEALAQMAAAARRQRFDDGEKLVREGESGDSLFILERGRVRVSKAGGATDSTTVEIAHLQQGDFFGEMSLLTGEPRSATITAVGGCDVLLLSKAAVAPVLAADPSIAGELSRSLAARAAATEAKLEDRRGRSHRARAPEESSLLHRIREFFSLPEV